MYCPLSDRINYSPDGGIEAETTGHVVRVTPTGGLTVTNRCTGETEFTW